MRYLIDVFRLDHLLSKLGRLVLCSLFLSTAAQAQIDVVFLIDGSGSIDAADFELERQGLSSALANATILPRDGSVGLAVVQFAGNQTQVEVPFTRIAQEADVAAVLGQLASMRQLGGSTNPGDGVLLANAILDASGTPAASQNICLATDGILNSGADLGTALDAGRTSAIGLDRFGVVAVEDPPNFFEADFQREYGPLVFGGSTVTVVRNAAEFANTIGTACFPTTLELIGLEVNQAIQDWINSQPLITGKATWVRAHVQTPESDPVIAAARLRGFRNGTELPRSPLVPANAGGSIVAPTDAAAERGDLDRSLYFRLPPEWTNGTVTLTVEGLGSELVCQEAAGTPNDCTVEVTFQEAETVEMKYYRVRFTEDGVTHQPSPETVDELVERQRAISPVAAVDHQSDTLDWRGPVPPDKTLLNLTLRTLRLLDGCWTSLGCERLYYGAMRYSSDLGGRAFLPGTVSSGSVPFAPFAYGRNRHVHEVGHSLGIDHAPFCNAPSSNPLPFDSDIIGGEEVATLGPMNQGDDRLIYGLDRHAGRVVDPLETFELMSYCGGVRDGARWISRTTYGAMLAEINDRFDASLRFTPELITKGSISDYLIVRGSIDLEAASVDFRPFGLLPSAMDPPGHDAGDYTLSLLDDRGQVLAEIPFAPDVDDADSPGPGGGGAEPPRGEFVIPVELDPAASRAEIRHDGTLIGALDASPMAPSVEVLFPNGGENLTGDRSRLAWQASDADGDPLVFTVQYSADGGATWRTLVVDWPDSEYEVERELLGGSTSALIRVLASDGFRVAIDTSDSTFSVDNLAPRVILSSPRTGQSFVGVQLLFLEATAQDREDGALASGSLRWTSSLDGDLGSGEELVLTASDLSVGQHEISVTATDSGGAAHTATATVNVGRIGSPPCVAGATVLCLNQDRFRVELDWADGSGGAGAGQVVPLRSDDSGMMWIYDAETWELLVKVLDGCDYNDHFWVFAAAPTTIEYTLRVTDTVTGSSTTYLNPLDHLSPAFTDTRAFTGCSAGSTAVHRVVELDRADFGGRDVIRHTGRTLTTKGSCMPDATHLCLGQDRFEVEVEWREFTDKTGRGKAVPGGTDTSALMWFFSAENWEMLIRVVDGCAMNGSYWVFAAAPTNVEYTLRVTDTESGEVVEYFNPLGTSANPITDTAAFSTCP